MSNKFLLLALFLIRNLFYGECLSKNEAVNKLLTQKFSMTADFTQVFTLDNRETITGTIKLKRPNFLKISLDAPLNSEVLINEEYIFQVNDFPCYQHLRTLKLYDHLTFVRFLIL